MITMTSKAMKCTTVYYSCGTMPRAVPRDGRVLVHNHIRHTTKTRCGARGFRAWTQPLAATLVKCSCGWSGLPHYRVKAVI